MPSAFGICRFMQCKKCFRIGPFFTSMQIHSSQVNFLLPTGLAVPVVSTTFPPLSPHLDPAQPIPITIIDPRLIITARSHPLTSFPSPWREMLGYGFKFWEFLRQGRS